MGGGKGGGGEGEIGRRRDTGMGVGVGVGGEGNRRLNASEGLHAGWNGQVWEEGHAAGLDKGHRGNRRTGGGGGGKECVVACRSRW